MESTRVDLNIKDLPDGGIEIENPNTGQAIKIKDKKLLGPLDILIKEGKLEGFGGSLHGEDFEISRETRDSLKITLDGNFVIIRDTDIVKVYLALINCIEDHDTYHSTRALMVP